MRLHPETALAVCLCLWIPVAVSYGALAPEDQDGSGDDEELSGSGSGDDDDMWIFEPEETTQPSPNTTKTAWSTDAPGILPERSVTQFVTHDPEPETSGHITEAPSVYTTHITETQPSPVITETQPSPVITETQPSPVIIKSFGSEDDQKEETTTIGDVALPETTVPPAEKLPVVPVHEERYTTTAYAEEDTTESSVIDQEEDESTVLIKTTTVKIEEPDMETTPVPLSTTSASNVADTEASGGDVESTTVQSIDDYLIKSNNIPEQREPKAEKPTTIDNDFDFDNEIRKPGLRSEQPGSESNFARGSASDSDSLLERKEVLAGVIAGGVVGLAFAIMLVALMVYRMKKKDEGSYSLDEHKHPNGGYQKPQKQEEFLA